MGNYKNKKVIDSYNEEYILYYEKMNLENRMNDYESRQSNLENRMNIYESRQNNLENRMNDYESRQNNLENRMNDYESRQRLLENRINDIYKNIKQNNKQEYENEFLVKDLINESNDKFRGKNLGNYIINKYRIEELGYQSFTPIDIEKENEMINAFIKEKLYDYMPENEKLYNETVGKFVYAIGGISRISQNIADKLYNELLEEYKKFLNSSNIYFRSNKEEMRKHFSIWIKKCLKENELYEYYSYLNIKEIEKYLYKKDNETNKILLKLFQSFICLYLKCRLSFPLVEPKYTNDNTIYDSRTMFDDCYKKGIKYKKVNFCYIPALISNGRFINNAKYYVFTYIKGKSFYIEGNVFNQTEMGPNSKSYNNSYSIKF